MRVTSPLMVPQRCRAPRSVNERRRSRRWWILPLVAFLAIVVLRGSADEPFPDAALDLANDGLVNDMRDRAIPPAVGGTRLELLDDAERPPSPVQWGSSLAPVPFGQWWSGLATGPDFPALWAQPLLLRMNDDGRADLSAPTQTTRSDGFRDADIVPALFFEFGPDPMVSVVDHGAFHVRFTVSTDEAAVTFTMIQGSPFIEIEGSGTLTMTVPALQNLSAEADGPSVDRFESAAGPWLLASSDTRALAVNGDRLVLELASGVRHAVGPAPAGISTAEGEDRYDAAALAVATDPLIDTYETLAVGATGIVDQVLHQERGSATPVAWSLLPHHQDHVIDGGSALGTLRSVYGPSKIVLTPALSLQYPSIPIVWGAVAPEGFEPNEIDVNDLPPEVIGSYFGAKSAATNAVVHDVLLAAGADGDASAFLDAARDSLGTLLKSGSEPKLAWDPNWGSVVIAPAEFGAGTQLNDHQLQYGYWVGAAASVMMADPAQHNLLEDGIDLLIADYAGSSVVPHLDGVVSAEGTWSSFAGHSWASGIGGFAAGNNLESISESSYAWWAAAKWFLATDRPELAEPFIARLTIESWLTGYEWLPTADRQSDDPTIRPWSGVVWASKNDPGTWFHASDEAALGIRLLPIGPQSFSRYVDAGAVEAAQDRWAWCDERGDGCIDRWWNLLDTDAAVAGLAPLPVGERAEESTTELVRRWWRAHWENGGIAEGWQCSPGATVRRSQAGDLVALVTNPSSTPATVTCVHERFSTFETVAQPRTAVLRAIDRA